MLIRCGRQWRRFTVNLTLKMISLKLLRRIRFARGKYFASKVSYGEKKWGGGGHGIHFQLSSASWSFVYNIKRTSEKM